MITIEDRLDQGLLALAVEVNAVQRQALLDLIALLEKWNKVYNLTAIRNRNDMVTHHLLDSLAVLPYLSGNRVIDVGTGAGLPGLPLAIMNPQRHFVLLDSNGKKIRFINQAVADLGLKNVEPVQCRIEDYQPGECFNTVTARAYATIATILEGVADFCCIGGQVLAMKGVYPDDELSAVHAPFQVKDIIALSVLGLNAERHLVRIEKLDSMDSA